MDMVITGAAGFLGSALVHAALAADHTVHALVRPGRVEQMPVRPGLRISATELHLASELSTLLRGSEVVIHAAAAKSGDYDAQFADTVLATRHLIEAMQRAGVGRLVGISSLSVYDYAQPPEQALLDERAALEAQPQLRDVYAQVKLLQEQELQRFAAAGGDLRILRPGVIYGPGQFWPHGLGHPIGSRAWLCMGPAQAELPLVHVANCAGAIIAAACTEGARGSCVNLVDDERPSRRQLLALLGQSASLRKRCLPFPWVLHRALARLIDGVNRRLLGGRLRLPGLLHPQRLDARFKALRYSNDRAKALLGWRPRITLREAIERA